MSELITRAEFDAFTPKEKGFYVYMVGARDDQPNVPESYKPDSKDEVEYEAGQMEAILIVQDEDD